MTFKQKTVIMRPTKLKFSEKTKKIFFCKLPLYYVNTHFANKAKNSRFVKAVLLAKDMILLLLAKYDLAKYDIRKNFVEK